MKGLQTEQKKVCFSMERKKGKKPVATVLSGKAAPVDPAANYRQAIEYIQKERVFVCIIVHAKGPNNWPSKAEQAIFLRVQQMYTVKNMY